MVRRLGFPTVVAAVLLSGTAAADEPDTRRLSHPLWLTGAALTVVGAPLTFFGMRDWWSGNAMYCEGGCPLEDDQLRGRTMFAYGLPALVLGVPLIIIGTRSVPVQTSPVSSWSVRPGSASVRWSF